MEFLTKLTREIKTYDIYGFDIETYSKHNLFLMGSIVHYSLENDEPIFEKLFYNKQEFIKFLLSMVENSKTKLVFATNLQFDILALFENTHYFDDLSFIIRSGDFISVKLNDNKRFLTFLDTMNFARYSVKKLGEILNKSDYFSELKKLDKPSCLGDIPKTKKDFKILEDYNLRDSEISCKFGLFLMDSFKKLGCEMKTTIASTSMDLFRRKYLTTDIKTPEKKLIELFYKAYYGGNTQIFKRGYVKDLNYYDFNSLYPSQYEKIYPNPNYLKRSNKNDKHLLNYEGISFCRIEIKNLHIPYLPHRDKKLYFPLGKFKGWYSHLELRKALSIGYKIKIFESIYYTQNFKPFHDFGKDLYKLRKKYKTIGSPFQLPIKILMNSLYGKFAQKYYYTEIENIKNYTYEQLDKLINKKDCTTHIIDKFAYITDYSKPIQSFINPILSIYITAYARLLLYESMEKIGFHNIYYCDTDSIITDKKIKTSDKLGELKLEHKIKHGVLVKPKFYGFISSENEEVIRCKGVPVFFHIKDKYKYFIELLSNPELSYERFTKFKQSIRSKTEHKYGKLKYNEKINVTKKLNLEDDKRRWNKKFNYWSLQESKPLIIK